MKIKYSPIKFNEYANIQASPNTQIAYVDENTVNVDGEDYEFDTDSVQFPDITTITNGVILEARREDGILHLTIRRFYTDNCADWDTAEYWEINK